MVLLVIMIVPVSSKETLCYEGEVVSVQPVGPYGAPTVQLADGTVVQVSNVTSITVGHVYAFYFMVTTYRLGGKIMAFSRYEEVS
jgi:hypothetical protein